MTPSQITKASKRLYAAIESAESWKGALLPAEWPEFEAEAAKCRRDLKMLLKLSRQKLRDDSQLIRSQMNKRLGVG